MKNGDLPASPQPITATQDGGVEITCERYHESGLTKREHFAAMAIQGLLAGGYCIDNPADRLTDASYEAVGLADALLKALEQE